MDVITYIAAAYGVTLLLVGGLVLTSWHRARSIRQQLTRAQLSNPQ